MSPDTRDNISDWHSVYVVDGDRKVSTIPSQCSTSRAGDDYYEDSIFYLKVWKM